MEVRLPLNMAYSLLGCETVYKIDYCGESHSETLQGHTTKTNKADFGEQEMAERK